MAREFDLVVLGAGTAASGAARRCARAGWSVAIVDELPYGGTCPLRGCDPKKMLRRGAEIVDAARRMRGKGIDDHGLAIEWADLVAFKRSFTEAMPASIESGLDKAGVTTLHGPARFVGDRAVEIDGEGRLDARHVLIATGARPRPLDVPGAEHLLDNADFMELEDLPDRILFVGGGYISFEFAHIAARAGASVTIINRGERPLKAFDRDLVDRLVAHGGGVGVDFDAGVALKSVERTDRGFRVKADSAGEEKEYLADLVVHGAGRVPAIDTLDLGAAGVEAGEGGVTVNEYLQSVSNPAVYAAGDVADTPGAPLTPVASLESRTAAANILEGNHARADYTGVPSVVFTLPELARVGLLEAEARDQGIDVRVAFNDTGDWFSNLRVGEDCAATKVLVDNATGRIVGAHLLGPEYAEIVNTFALAMRFGLTVDDLKSAINAYPTVGSDLSSML